MRLFITVAIVLFAVCLPLMAEEPVTPEVAPIKETKLSTQAESTVPKTKIDASAITEAQLQQAIARIINENPEQIIGYENKILDRSETYYNNKFNFLLWIFGISFAIFGLILPLYHRSDLDGKFKAITKEIKERENEHKKSFDNNNSDIREAFKVIGEKTGKQDAEFDIVKNEITQAFEAIGKAKDELEMRQGVMLSHIKEDMYSDKASIYVSLSTASLHAGDIPSSFNLLLQSILARIQGGRRGDLEFIDQYFDILHSRIPTLKQLGPSVVFYEAINSTLELIETYASKLAEPAIQDIVLIETAKIKGEVDDIRTNPG